MRRFPAPWTVEPIDAGLKVIYSDLALCVYGTADLNCAELSEHAGKLARLIPNPEGYESAARALAAKCPTEHTACGFSHVVFGPLVPL